MFTHSGYRQLIRSRTPNEGVGSGGKTWCAKAGSKEPAFCVSARERRFNAFARQRQVADADAKGMGDGVGHGGASRAGGGFADAEGLVVDLADEGDVDLRHVGET